MVGLMFTIDDRSFEGYYIFVYCEFALLFLLPVYGLAILGLTAQRILRKTNSVGLTLFQLLSMVLPTLLLILWLDVHFRSPVGLERRLSRHPLKTSAHTQEVQSQNVRLYTDPCQTVERDLQRDAIRS